MDKMISRFMDQLEEAIQIGQSVNINSPQHKIQNILVSGLGGSGIGADFVQQFIRNEAQLPFHVNKEYDIPNWVSEHTLAILSSYSGNTEETLSALGYIEQTGAKIVVVASGGKLIERAKEKNYDYVQVPNNWASPRACLGYSVVQQLYVLNALGIISKSFEKHLQDSIRLLRLEKDDIKNRAEKVAHAIYKKTAVIYSTHPLQPNAVRLRQQINENSKALCWHNYIPEMNHNELVGWKDQRDDLAVLVLRDSDDYVRNQMRIEINKEIISKLSSTWIELYAKGSSLIEKSFYLVHLSDWISWYMAELRGVDAIEVNVIDFLKSELGKQPMA